MPTIKQKMIFLVLIALLLAVAQTPFSSHANEIDALSSQPQGLSPFAIEITKDGQYAYLSFDLSEDIFKVRLTDLTIVATADLSAYFPIECEHIALDADEKKLFVYSSALRKLLVLDTETMGLVHTIDDYGLFGMFRSRFGSHLITWDGGNTVKFVNTETYAITESTDPNLGFVSKIQEDQSDPNKWYVVTQLEPGGRGSWSIGKYDHIAKSWSNSVTPPVQSAGEGLFDFRVLPNGQKAYVASIGGYYPDNHAYGWLYAIDLVTKQVKVVSIDGGAFCLESNPDGTRLFVGTGWPQPDTNNLLVVDTVSDSILGSIPLGQNMYGWRYTQMNDLQIDPSNSSLLYATSCDGNALIKIDINSLSLAGVRVLNNETLNPHFFVKRPSQSFGNILIHNSAKSFELNLDNATIQNTVTFPSISQDAYAYDIGVLNSGRLLIAQGNQFLEVDPQGKQLIATHLLPQDIPAIWHFVLSNDKTKIYTVPTTNPSDLTSKIFLAINTNTFQVEKQLNLEGGSFEFRPFELPDGSKLYTLGGLHNGPVVVHVIRTSDYTIQKTITFDQSDRLGISTGPCWPYAYDPVSQTLFVGSTHVVLAIDTTTDVIKKVIYLGDVGTAIGVHPGQFTYINVVGIVYNPMENYLYIAHGDRSFVSIYDLTNGRFLPKVIPLKGYFPSYLFANDAIDKIYSLNSRSDNVSVIDVSTKTVEKVIDLHNLFPRISVSPANQTVTKDAGITTFSVSNTGTETMPWIASVISGGSWLSITSGASGTNFGTIACDFTANTGTSARTGTLRVTATGVTDSPVDVTVAQAASTPPAPDIKANGQDGPLTVSSGTPISITASLAPGTENGKSADWWIAGSTPWGLYTLTASGWSPGINMLFQYPLFSVSPVEIYNGLLPIGDYAFYFGVDMSPNGVLDSPLYYDFVQVHVTN